LHEESRPLGSQWDFSSSQESQQGTSFTFMESSVTMFAQDQGITVHTVDGRNPAPVEKVVYPITYKVLYIPHSAGFLPSTILSDY